MPIYSIKLVLALTAGCVSGLTQNVIRATFAVVEGVPLDQIDAALAVVCLISAGVCFACAAVVAFRPLSHPPRQVLAQAGFGGRS